MAELFSKYFEMEVVDAQSDKDFLMPLILSKEPIFGFGSSINAITHLHGKMFIS